MAELQRLEVNLVGDRQRELFDRFVECKDELETRLARRRAWQVRFPAMTLEVLRDARRRMLEAADEGDPDKPDSAV
jgi:hypothetical protein